jgi:hypothetical protein
MARPALKRFGVEESVCDGGGGQNELSTSGSLERALLKLALHQSLADPQEMAEILERERPELSTFAVRGGVQFI